jgi:tetratricopeptide (TPR) repeat protein
VKADPAVLSAASATRPLGGRKIQPLNTLTAVLAVSGLCVLVTPVLDYFVRSGAIGLTILINGLAVVVLTRRHNAAVTKINSAVKLIERGDFEGAERVLVPVATSRASLTCVALALYNLGTASLRSGDLASAAALYRAALALYGAQRIRNLRSGKHLARSGLAFTLLCQGELAGAEETLAEPIDVVVPSILGSEHVTRALILLRRGDPRAALDYLARNHVFLRNACAGEGAALAEATEASARDALERAGDPYRGQSTGPRRVPVDPFERAYVLRALPGCESVLIDA